MSEMSGKRVIEWLKTIEKPTLSSK
jgi:hypothetical protein